VGSRSSLPARPFVRHRHVLGAHHQPRDPVLPARAGAQHRVGFAGLLDLGYIAFYAVGAYVYALLASPHFNVHLPFWIILPIGAAVACLFGALLGAPTLKLRGDYLAIVTLGFGEIIRIFMNNLSQPVNITNGPRGLADRPVPHRKSFDFEDGDRRLTPTGPMKYYYLLLPSRSSSSRSTWPAGLAHRPRLGGDPRGRGGGARHRHRHHPREVAGLRHGRHFRRRGRRHVLFHPGLHQPGKLRPDRIGDDPGDGGAGRHGQHLGRVGAVLLSFVPEILRYTVEPAQKAIFGRMIVDPEVIRMLLFGLALVLMMLFRPAGILPSALRKRELETRRNGR
jgi:branched-chain amino acid transport system permease protein